MTEITDELLARSQADQKMRNDAMAGKSEWDNSVDRENTEYLKELIGKNGWPKKSVIGDEAARAAWLLAQHADHDPDFQENCLKLMKELPDGEVDPAKVAYLEDRVLVNRGQPQIYGTQFYQDGEYFGPRPITDVETLDERRAAVGLGPFKDYEAMMIDSKAD